MGMGPATWQRYSAARQEWEHKGWLLCHSFRTKEGRRYNFAAKRIFSRSNLGDAIPFNNLDELLAYIAAQPTEVQAPLPAVIVIKSAETPTQRVRRRAR